MNLIQLENLIADIRQISFTDDKTLLSNALALDHEVTLIEKGASKFNLIVFGDLNDFKQLNDVYGYDAGDVAINKVGETIYNSCYAARGCGLNLTSSA